MGVICGAAVSAAIIPFYGDFFSSVPRAERPHRNTHFPVTRKLADQMTEDDARRLLSEAKTGNFAEALRVVLKSYRADGWLTISQAAVLSGMSVRSFQRRLADEDCSFSELVDQVRRELATEMLQNTDLSLGEIATKLGYSAEENFIRAFRRWNGTSPGEFRRG